jgi:hypothetical protein
MRHAELGLMYAKRLQEPLREDVLVAQLDLALAEQARMAHCTPLVALATIMRSAYDARGGQPMRLHEATTMIGRRWPFLLGSHAPILRATREGSELRLRE